MPHIETKTARGKKQAIFIVSLVILIILVAMAFYFRTELFGLLGAGTVASEGSFDFEYDAGAVHVAQGENLVLSDGRNVSVLDKNGNIVIQIIFEAEDARSDIGGDYALLYDYGGQGLCLIDGDKVSVKETEAAISFAAVSESGHVAVLTEQAGYKGVVTVYDTQMEAMYRVYTTTAQVLKAEVCPKGDLLALLEVNESGSRLRTYDMQMETVLGEHISEDRLYYDMAWTKDDRISLVSESGVLSVNEQGEEEGRYEYEYLTLYDYCFVDGELYIAQSAHSGAMATELLRLSEDSEVESRAALEQGMRALVGGVENAVVMYDSQAYIYNRALGSQYEVCDLSGVKEFLMGTDPITLR